MSRDGRSSREIQSIPGAQASITGRLAVCAGSCGPGHTHLVQGPYDAHRNGAPVLAIASHVPTEQIGTGYFQETHPQHPVAECSHTASWSARPSRCPACCASPSHRARQGGVAVLVLPGDVAHRHAVPPTGRTTLPVGRSQLVPPPEQVQALADGLNRARTVTPFCSAGVAGAHDDVMALAARLHSPVAHSLRGKETQLDLAGWACCSASC
jgi:pyruvate dehydrogenase (quinone)